MYKSGLQPALEKVQSKNNDTIWVKMRKTFFEIKDDYYLACLYIPPENSTFSRKIDYFQFLSQEVAFYSSKGEVILLGDLNARIGQKIEEHSDISEIYSSNISCTNVQLDNGMEAIETNEPHNT